jgi:hypothetical protein
LRTDGGLKLAIEGVREAAVEIVVLGIGGVERDEPVRFRVGQWMEQDGVDDAEDGSVGADAEGQGDERDQREARALDQGPEA